MSDQPQRSALWIALGLVGQLGFQIAIPLVVFALLGRFLDRNFGTSPWLFLAGIVLSIIASSAILMWRFSRLMRQIDSSMKK